MQHPQPFPRPRGKADGPGTTVTAAFAVAGTGFGITNDAEVVSSFAILPIMLTLHSTTVVVAL